MSTEDIVKGEAQNHRTRVGQERREKMRARLIESAFVVFARKGVDVSVIDDVIAEAGVSRGTFYNYFRTNTELMAAVGETLSNELVSLIEATVGQLENPVEILATGLRLFLRTARLYPHYAGFIWRAGFNLDAAGHLIYTYLPRHISGSMARGSVQVRDVDTALALIVGIMLSALFGISTRSPEEDFPEHMVYHALLALGVQAEEATRLVQLPLPGIELPEDSLLVRTRG